MNRACIVYRASPEPHGRALPLVSLTLTSAQVQHSDGVQLSFDVAPYEAMPFHCLWLVAEISDRSTRRRYYGRVDIEIHERPSSNGRAALRWLWRLLPEEIETVDAGRSPVDGPVHLWLHIGGVAAVADEPVPIVGDQQIELSQAEWQRIQLDLAYEVPPSQERLLSPANLRSPNWRSASEHLAKARGRLAAGDGYDAMQDVLGEFEALVSAPYKLEAWKEWLAELPEQKAESIASLLSGYCTFLNRVGHHRAKVGRADDGRLPPMPVDQWEAELAVAIGQYLLSYAMRIRPALGEADD